MAKAIPAKYSMSIIKMSSTPYRDFVQSTTLLVHSSSLDKLHCINIRIEEEDKRTSLRD